MRGVVAIVLLLAAPPWALAAPCPQSDADGNAVVCIRNAHSGEVARVLVPADGTLTESEWMRANRLFRSRRTGWRRPVHPRLLDVLGRLQRSFGGRELVVVSGYRVPEGTALSSYHNVGRAADLRIAGVGKRDLFRACRKLQARLALGCGFYPNANFIHVDVRERRSGVWVDTSAPGQPRRYVAHARDWLRRRGL